MAKSKHKQMAEKGLAEGEMLFVNDENVPTKLVDLSKPEERGEKTEFFPAPILEELEDEDLERCKLYLDRQIKAVQDAHSELEPACQDTAS